MKTIADAHRELNGDLNTNVLLSGGVNLFFNRLDNHYVTFDNRYHQEDYYQYVCTVEEFNNYKGESIKPVFTQEMSDNRKLPPIGSDVEYNDDIDFDFKFDWDNGDIITCVFHSTNDKGEPIGVYRHNDGVTVSLVTNLIRPIDTRTDKEKAIDDIMKNNPAFIRADESDIRTVLNAAYDKWVGK